MRVVVTKIEEIRDSTSEQSRATDAMVQATVQMSASARDSDAQARAANQVVVELHALASERRVGVARFKL
jgi:methyl-accepting chemotaxis protein